MSPQNIGMEIAKVIAPALQSGNQTTIVTIDGREVARAVAARVKAGDRDITQAIRRAH